MLFLPFSIAAEHHVANSRDWRDVYSVMLFGQLSSSASKFLTSPNHAEIILYSIPKEGKLNIYSSKNSPFVANYATLARSKGYEDTEEIVSDKFNLELAKKLQGINKFIIIDDSYGYNAIAAAPYAAVDRYYVLFADSGNIDEIDNFLSGKNPSSVILFGQLDSEVKQALSKYNPTVINKGSRFENNKAMVERYLKVKPTRQVVLTNGEFIEQSFISGDDPVLFIGKSNVPDNVRQYIASSDFDVAILVGNELIGVATTIRRQIGISVFVKFAQGARTPAGPISQVEDLDRFPMPIYQLDVGVDSVVYNSATNTLEVTYKNNADLAAYISSTIVVLPDNKTLQDDNPFFLDRREFKTILYSKLRDGSDFFLDTPQSKAQITTFYGESPSSLDNSLIRTFDISMIAVLDNSEIELQGLVYDKTAQRFYIKMKNLGESDVYAKPEVVDVLVNDEAVTRASEKAVFLKKGESKEAPIRLKLSEADILDNEKIRVRAYYGVRENSLVKIIIADFEMKLAEKGFVVYIVMAVLVLLLAVLLFARKECAVCKLKNPVYRARCKRCKANLKKRK